MESMGRNSPYYEYFRFIARDRGVPGASWHSTTRSFYTESVVIRGTSTFAFCHFALDVLRLRLSAASSSEQFQRATQTLFLIDHWLRKFSFTQNPRIPSIIGFADSRIYRFLLPAGGGGGGVDLRGRLKFFVTTGAFFFLRTTLLARDSRQAGKTKRREIGLITERENSDDYEIKLK